MVDNGLHARRRRAVGLLPALVVALVLVGCGDDDRSDEQTSDQSLQVSHNERDFALQPGLQAEADDLVTLQLEEPAGDDAGDADTGEAAGVDVVPYVYDETAERTFCWSIAGDEAPSGPPSYMELRDEVNAVVARVEEGGECVTRTIAAGTYRAVFRNRAGGSAERDLLFIVPTADAPAAAALTAADPPAAPQDEPPALQVTEPQPSCTFAVLTSPEYVPPFFPGGLMQLSVVDSGLGLGLYYVAGGGCSDVSLIHDTRPRRDNFYRLAAYPGFKARIYDELFFRGPRRTVKESGTDALVFYEFTSPASLVLVAGEPKPNRDFLIVTNGCVGCDLSGINLDGVDLHGAWLHHSDLSHASFDGSNLRGVAAPGAIFKSAYLRGADLSGADLRGAAFDSAGAVADMSGTVYPAADLSQAKLDDAQLVNATLRGATLTDATLARATLDFVDLREISAAGAVFQDASMPSTALSDATLTRADLSRVNLDGRDLSRVDAAKAIFRGASLRAAMMADANLNQADLSGARLDGIDLSRVAASNANFADAVLPAAILADGGLTGADFSRAVLDGGDLRRVGAARAIFTDASLKTVRLANASLTQANLSRARLDGADLTRVAASDATLRNTTLDNALLTNGTFLRASFDGASLQRANLQGASLANARLEGARLDAALLHKDDTHLAASLDGAYMANARLDSANLTGVSMVGARFYGRDARAVGAILDQANLGNAVLSGANFTGASLRSTSLANAVCVNCSFNTARLGRTSSSLTDAASFVGTDLRGADFTQATVEGCNFTGALVSFPDISGIYRYGEAPDVVYSAPLVASRMDKVRTEASVRCPDGTQGPCDDDKLRAPQPTPTRTATATPAMGCTPKFPTICPMTPSAP